jgi:cysteine desulfurase
MRTYLDHNATSPLRRQALNAVHRVLEDSSGNASSIHDEGRVARARIEAARSDVASLVGAAPRDVIFTSGGTEAIAAAIVGACMRAPAGGRRIVTTAVEHSAVLESARFAARLGHRVDVVPCDAEGRVDPDDFASRLDSDVVLAAMQWANNETGVLQPVEAVRSACAAHGTPFLVDAVQAAGKLPAWESEAPPELLAISAHKIGGPQGAGALIARAGVALVPLIAGGGQERRRRGGTEAVASLAGFGAAARAARAEVASEAARLGALRDGL